MLHPCVPETQEPPTIPCMPFFNNLKNNPHSNNNKTGGMVAAMPVVVAIAVVAVAVPTPMPRGVPTAAAAAAATMFQWMGPRPTAGHCMRIKTRRKVTTRNEEDKGISETLPKQ